MDRQEQIIAIIFGDKKYFFKASLLSVADASEQNISAKDVIPDGKVKEYYADLCMEKTYKNGMSDKALTFTEKTERTIKPNWLVVGKKQGALVPMSKGKTFLRNIHQRIFFVNGVQTALQELNSAEEVVSTTGKAFSGEAKEFYSNGSLKKEAFFENGLPCGIVKTYDKKGRLISQEEYKDGLRHGKAKRFNYIKGLPCEEDLFYKNGVRHGQRKVLSPDGKLLFSENYENGKKNGERLLYNSKGNLEVKEFFKNGLKEGKRIFYYDNGQIMHEEYFKKDRLQGERKTFSREGKLLAVKNYKDNKPDGTAVFYAPDGKITKRLNYKDGTQLTAEEN